MASPRAVIYTRLSLDLREGEGLERQEYECRQLADREGYRVVAVYKDESKSAYSGVKREGFNQMLQDAQHKDFDAILVWATDRLYRRVVDLEKIIPILDKAKIPVLSVKSSRIDLSTADGRGTARLLATVAQLESDKKSERVAARAQQRVRDGVVTTGTRPFGWEWKKEGGLEPHPLEAPLVRELFDRYVAGESMRGLATWLNNQGVKTTQGYKWSQPRISSLLRNPRYAGLLSYKNSLQTGKSKEGKIIEPSVWRKAKQRWSREPIRKGAPNKSWVSPLLVCGVCGGSVRASSNQTKNGRYKTYDCIKHKHISWQRQTIEDVVSREMLLFLKDAVPLLVEEAEKDRLEREQYSADPSVVQELEQLLERKEELARMFAIGDISGDNYKMGVSALDEQYIRLESAIQPAEAASITKLLGEGDVRTAWEQAPLEVKIVLSQTLLEKVVVFPKRSSGVIDVQWKTTNPTGEQ